MPSIYSLYALFESFDVKVLYDEMMYILYTENTWQRKIFGEPHR